MQGRFSNYGVAKASNILSATHEANAETQVRESGHVTKTAGLEKTDWR